MDKFFHSDHHWNIRGAWAGSENIYEMFRAHNPEIGPRLILQGTHLMPGVKYMGSFASQSFYPVTPDAIEIADVKMPPYDLYIHQEKLLVKERLPDLEKITSSYPYYDYYRSLYLPTMDIREYDFHNNTARNLLIIGDSYANSMEVYVASYYNQPYHVDLRYYKNFSLGKFIRKHQIDDVLILGGAAVDYGDLAWMIKP
jgi:hypothetical protein